MRRSPPRLIRLESVLFHRWILFSSGNPIAIKPAGVTTKVDWPSVTFATIIPLRIWFELSDKTLLQQPVQRPRERPLGDGVGLHHVPVLPLRGGREQHQLGVAELGRLILTGGHRSLLASCDGIAAVTDTTPRSAQSQRGGEVSA